MESGPDRAELETITAQFLKSSVFLIVDQNSGARVGIKKLLGSMGAELHRVLEAATYQEADDLIRSRKPNVVFCDFQVGDRSGLSLLQAQRQERTEETSGSLFILVTGNTSQSAVAQAAEEDVDAYVLKPYTAESFRISLFRAIQLKLRPTEYVRMIEQGKELLKGDRLDEAMSVFGSAMTKDSRPSLACFYEGLVHVRKNSLEWSQISYQKGLTFNQIHYKCLVGLFDLLMSLKKYEFAYALVQKIVRFFPANPKRLSVLLKLAIQTKHYADVETFYQEFLKMGERNDELIKCVCSALIVCGKHFLMRSDPKTGIEMIRKAAVTAAGRHFLLMKAVEALTASSHYEEAKAVFKRFANPRDDDPHYAAAALMILGEEAKPELLASKGQELLKRGVSLIEVFRLTADNLDKCGLGARAGEVRAQALKHYPELNDEEPGAA